MVDYYGPAVGGRQLMMSITSTQDVNTNTSSVRTILRIINGSFVADSNMQVGMAVDGVQAYWWEGYASWNAGTLVLADVTRTIPHNADGTRQVSFSAGVYAAYTGYVNLTINVNWLTLPTIPRATTPNWSSDFTTDVAQNINLPRASASFTHDVTYKFGTQTGTIATGAGVTASWTPPATLLTEIPNTATGSGTITVVTKSGASVIGSKAVQFNLVAAANVVPTVTSVVWDDANTTVKTNIGAFVQGLSLIKGSVTASGVYNSTITERRLKLGATQVPENTAFQIAGSGTISASGEAVDSRGRLGTAVADFTVLAYTPPTLGASGWQVRRANSSNTPTDTGEYLRIDLHAVAASLIVAAAEKNALTISVRTRPVGGSWTARNTITPGLTHNTSFQVSGGGTYLVTTSYEVEISLTDKTGIEATRLVTTIPTAAVTLDLNGNNVGVGKYWEQGTLDVGGDIYMNGTKVSVDGHVHSAANITSGTLAVDRLPAATDTTIGAVERATQTETDAGTDTTRYVTPASVRNRAYAPYAMAAGNASISATPYTTVTLPVGRFSQPPIVDVRVATSASGQVLVPWPGSAPTTTSFTYATISMGGVWTASAINWIAVQMTETASAG